MGKLVINKLRIQVMRPEVPYLQIRSDCIVSYYQNESSHRRYGDFNKNPYSGKMQSHSQKRIKKAVDLLLQRSEPRVIYNEVIGKHHDFRINFVTLTIAHQKNLDAKYCYQNLLKPFLRTARRKWKVEDYIWKAELQNRGQLHYHLTTNQFIRFDHLRNEWNKLQKRNGLLQEYASKHGHFNPNSTDVHAVWKVRNLKAYLSKYIAKVEADKEALNGKVWDCSQALKRNYYSFMMSSYEQDLINDAVANGQAKMIANDHCVIFKCDNPTGILSKLKRESYENHIFS